LPSSARTTAASDEAVDVILRDGTTLRLRAPASDDADALVAFFGDLSEQSRYLRFHGTARVDRALVEHFLSPDWDDRGTLVGAFAAEPGAERIVAVAEFARLRDPTSAEVAFAVADDLQGRGVGTRLLERLAARASEAGVERFVAEVLPENAPMLAVFRDAGFEVSRQLEGGEIEVRFPIATTEHFRARVDERDHLAVVASLRPFFAPTTVAVIGGGPRRGSIAGELFLSNKKK
jgi:RimJ/RimL family protein N-acetyltransferase